MRRRNGNALQVCTQMNGIGFDLGNTLIDYKDIPLSWQSLYRNALRDMAANCRFKARTNLV